MLTIGIEYSGEHRQLEWTTVSRVDVDKANGALILEDSYGTRIITAESWKSFSVQG